MPPPLIHFVLPAALPAHCEPSSPLLTAISSYLHICLPSPLGLLSSLLGTLSIVSWLFAQLPQIYKNYALQSTSGLSLFFLVEWCLGDTTNLVGALLTRQAGWQVVIAGYYVFVDVILVLQFFWYTHYKPSREAGYPGHLAHHPSSGPNTSNVLDGLALSDDGSDDFTSRLPPADRSEPKAVSDGAKDAREVAPASSPYNQSRSYSNEKVGSPGRRTITRSGSRGASLLPGASSPRTLLLASMLCAMLAQAAQAAPIEPTSVVTAAAAPMSTSELVGRIVSWFSTILYLGSRPPQLYKNYCRKSTSGLSPLLFMAAFCGNFFYSASLLTNPNAWSDFPPYGGGGWADSHGNDHLDWLMRTTPFFLGAAGVLGLDGFMGVQFLMYGSNDEDDDSSSDCVFDEAVDDNDALAKQPRGRRWKHVRGWMRGWIPSDSPERRPTQETQSLLVDARENYGTV
ncbi:hypothetical protein ASPZODRAFT_128343 [Penicilliopsis zonata CBS 506.65]|uniref:PQ loop repeat protein n=1 Tax=Penicilliopsis zonata CBS 506.65 TaxID=1073090 RepID=A0A1L9SRS6_9EURO|nr:hypothetical protein ASPZODRAFT_128343 [Penicilliopsis zonata CBS 506.65]OJJ49813.1 hypothetical protein ASPZODRAFT_128343 [Penicilliopsis zonata CBS 506.65]